MAPRVGQDVSTSHDCRPRARTSVRRSKALIQLCRQEQLDAVSELQHLPIHMLAVLEILMYFCIPCGLTVSATRELAALP